MATTFENIHTARRALYDKVGGKVQLFSPQLLWMCGLSWKKILFKYIFYVVQCILSFAKGAFKYGWRMATFTGVFIFISTAIPAYRGKHSVFELVFIFIV